MGMKRKVILLGLCLALIITFSTSCNAESNVIYTEEQIKDVFNNTAAELGWTDFTLSTWEDKGVSSGKCV